MKLPQVEFRGVETVGRHDLAAVQQAGQVAAGKGQAIQQVSEQFASIARDYNQRREDAEYNEQIATMKSDMMQWESVYNTKQFYTVDELGDISEEAVKRTTTSTDELGATVTQDRQNIPAHEVYPLILQKKLDGMIEEKANKISNAHLRKQFLTTAKPYVADKMMKATVAAEEAQQAYTQRLYEEKANEAAQLQDLDSAVFFIDQMEIDDLTKRDLVKKAEAVSENAFYVEVMRSSDSESILLARSLLEDPNYDGALPESRRQAAVKDLNARLDQLGSEALADKASRHAQVVNGLSVGIVDGQVTRMQLDEAYALQRDDDSNPDGITPAEHTALVKQLAASERASKDVVNYQTIVDGWRSGEVPADPSNTDHKKAMEWFVAKNGLTRDNVLELGILAKSTGIIPEALKVKVNGQILNGDVMQAGVGLTYFNNLKEGAPHLVSGFSEDTKKVARLGTQLMNAGIPQEKAIETARQYLVDVTPEIEKYYDQALRDQDTEMASDLEDLMDDDPMYEVGLIEFGIAPHPDMIARFDSLTRVYYPMTKGNLAQAQRMAYEGLQEEWGQSAVGLSNVNQESGKRSMRFPPERMLQASTSAVQSGLEMFAEDQELNKDQIILVADAYTGQNRSWAVITFDEETGEFKKHDTNFEGLKWVNQGYDRDWEKEMEIEKYKITSQKTLERQQTPNYGMESP